MKSGLQMSPTQLSESELSTLGGKSSLSDDLIQFVS